MMRACRFIGFAGALLAMAAISTEAQGKGLGRKLVRGLTNSLTPTIGAIQNGPNVNNNIFAQRFSENPLTKGRSYEFERIFGDDSYGNADTLNLGLLNVQLRQPDGSGLQGSGVYNKIGYNLRLVPELYWEARSTGRNISGFAGAAAVAAPIQYNIDANNGFESSNLSGQIIFDSKGSMNILGFYDMRVIASNTGQLTTDGVGEDRNQDVNFDIGPVNVSGNVWVDTALAVADLIGEQVFGIPPDDFNPGLARERNPDEISAAIAAGQAVSGPELAALLDAHMADPEGVPLPENPNSPLAAAATPIVPEPGTLLFLATGLAAWTLPASRRRHAQ